MKLPVAKKKAIDGFVDAYSPNKVEEEKNPVVYESEFSEIFGKYQIAGKKYNLELAQEIHDFIREDNEVTEVYTPGEISEIFLFLQKVLQHENNYVGVFVSKLIQNSYLAGNNNFSLQAISEVFGVGACVKGMDGDVISISVMGEALSGIGSHCSFASFDISEGRNLAAWSAQDSSFSFKSDAGQGVGFEARRCEFMFQGSVDRLIGMGAESCTFKTTRKDTLEELLQWVSFDKLESPSGNRIYFVRNGKQKLIRDYRRGGLDVL